MPTGAWLPWAFSQSRRPGSAIRGRPPPPGRSSPSIRSCPDGIAGIASARHSPRTQRALRHPGGASRRSTTAGSSSGVKAASKAIGGAENASHSSGSMVGRRKGTGGFYPGKSVVQRDQVPGLGEEQPAFKEGAGQRGTDRQRQRPARSGVPRQREQAQRRQSGGQQGRGDPQQAGVPGRHREGRFAGDLGGLGMRAPVY